MTSSCCRPGADWAAGDVLYHQLLDARRALVILATPAAPGQRPDVDHITYWGRSHPQRRSVHAR